MLITLLPYYYNGSVSVCILPYYYGSMAVCMSLLMLIIPCCHSRLAVCMIVSYFFMVGPQAKIYSLPSIHTHKLVLLLNFPIHNVLNMNIYQFGTKALLPNYR